MSTMKETATQFFDACETGKGWGACREFCHSGATFTAQADTFDGIDTLEGYTDAMKGLLAGPIPDARRTAAVCPRSRSSRARTRVRVAPYLRAGSRSRRTTCT